MFRKYDSDVPCANCGHPKMKHTGSKILGGGQKCTEKHCPCVFYRSAR